MAVQLFNDGCAPLQETGKIPGPRAVHGIHYHPEACGAYGFEVHEAGYMAEVWFGWRQVFQQGRGPPGANCGLVHRPHTADGFLQVVGDLLGGAAGVFGLELEAVPRGRVVAGRDYRCPPGAVVQHVVAQDGRWRGLHGEERSDAFSGRNAATVAANSGDRKRVS